MKAIILRILSLGSVAAVGLAQNGGGFVCDIPTSGCTNGMFNQAKCECECISPFCRDSNGDCMIPSNNCGGNPWSSCTRGVNCPWWVNPLKAESCHTGPEVPMGLWQIYNTEAACCNNNFAYSTSCNVQPASPQPTKHPTIAISDEDDDFEIIPMKFDMRGLPDDFKMSKLKEEMFLVLKRVLLRLAERIPGLKISEIEERTAPARRALRGLEQDVVSMYFNVYAIRDDDGTRFGPLIIQEIRDAYDEILSQIQTFSDTNYFGGDLDLNFCTSDGGKYTYCTTNVAIFEGPPAVATTTMQTQYQGSGGGGGLAGWAVFLIVMSVFFIIAGIGYFVYVHFFGYEQYPSEKYTDDKSRGSGSKGSKVHNYLPDDDKSRATAFTRGNRSRASRLRGDKSQASKSVASRRQPQNQLALTNAQAPKYDDGSFTINSHTSKKKIARDPTMYIAGQEDRPDPSVAGKTMRSEKRQYTEEPALKLTRDPTQYVDGKSYQVEDRSRKPARDPTLYMEGTPYLTENPPLKPKRDPTLYEEGGTVSKPNRDPTLYEDGPAAGDGAFSVLGGHSTSQSRRVASAYTDGSDVEEVYNDDHHQTMDASERYGIGGINEEADEFSQSSSAGRTQEPEVEPYSTRGSYSMDGSYRTQEPPSVASKSVKSKKLRRGSKQSRAASLRKSLQSNWGTSLPDVGNELRHATADNPKKTSQSFYK